MDFESLIWAVIFLIYIASVVLKRIRSSSKAKKKAAATTRTGWKEKLTKFQRQIQDMFSDFMKQMQQEVEAAKKKDSEKETGWEKLLPPKDDEPEPVAEQIELMDVSPDRPRKIVGEEIAFRWEDAAEKKEPVVPEKEPLAKDLPYGIQDLRRAVIWSEILAPPVALREERF